MRRSGRGWRVGAGVLAVAAAVGVGMAALWRAGRPAASWPEIQRAIDERRWGEAEPALVDWLGRHPDDGRAWLRLGSLRGSLGREAEAVEALRRIGPDDPARSGALVLIGDLELKRDDARAAEAAYREALAREPGSAAALSRLLGVLLVTWRKDEARAVLRDLHRLTGDSRHLIARTGLALEEAQPQQVRELGGEIARLEEGLARLLAASPDDPILRRARGLLRLDQGRPADARADLEFSAARLDGDPAGRLALAECRLALGEADGIDEALGPMPERPAARGRWWLLKGRAAEILGRDAEALDCFREAVAADPEGRAARYQLGRALSGGTEPDPEAAEHLGRAEAIRLATDALKQALYGRASVDDPAECLAIARTCLDLAMPAEARAWFGQALRADPTLREAQLALARLGDAELPPTITPTLRQDGPAGPADDAPRETVAEAGAPAFEDVADRAGLRFRYDSGERGDLFIADTMGGGVGLIDVDGDGWLDVYFVNACKLPYDPADPPAPNKLFRNRGDGTFEDVTERAGVGGRGYGMGCAVSDYDGDGHDDLFVTGFGSTVLYRNRGDGTFEDVTEKAGVASDRWTTAAGFADLDGDGDLDLVAITYVAADPASAPECRDAANRPIHCPPGKFPAQVDHLFRNEGDGTFVDVAAGAGLDVPDGRGLGLAIVDLDGDGQLDIYVANDAVPDFLFRNLGGLAFEEVGAASGAAYSGDGLATASMGVVAEDLDGDGLVDLFHTNFRNEGSTLLRNLGDGLFADASARSGLDGASRPVTGFGAAALDFDGDGRVDLFAANGHVDDQPWLNQPMAQPPHLYAGRPGGRFELLSPGPAGPYFGREYVGRGAAAGDLDNDGRVDLVVVHRDAPAALLRNAGRSGRWLSVRLLDASGRPAVGARVTCRLAGGLAVARHLASGTGYLSAHDARLHFGLGAADAVEELEVRWPSGRAESWSGLPVDRRFLIREGGGPTPDDPR